MACVVQDCIKLQYGQQPYCLMHYQRVRKHGDPHITKRTYRLGTGDTQIERFWSLVNKNTSTGCWEWTGNLYATGYGSYYFDGKTRRAHRIAMFLTTKRWATQFILHSCDNRLCVNPEHLREGNAKDNAADAVARHRTPQGEKHGSAKLTGDQVVAIRDAYKTGIRQQRLADIFNIHQAHVSDIVNYKRWGHI